MTVLDVELLGAKGCEFLATSGAPSCIGLSVYNFDLELKASSGSLVLRACY